MAHETHTATEASCCATTTDQVDAPAQASSGCCGGHGATHQIAPTSTGHEGTATDQDVTTCPVMPGSPVVKAAAEAAGLYRDYNGERYWFCCAACGPMFDADPDKYATTAA